MKNELAYKGKRCTAGGDPWKLSQNWSKKGSRNIDK